MRWDAMSFINNNLRRANCHKYYEQACVLQNKKVLGVLVDFCAKEFCEISHDEHAIVESAAPPFWIHVLKKCKVDAEMSLHASTLISHVCQKNELDLSTFRDITNETYIPRIHPTAALDLLQAEAGLVNYDELSNLTSLQERCIVSLSRKYQSLFDDEAATEILHKQGARFLSKFLVESLRFSSNEIRSRDTEIESKRKMIIISRNDNSLKEQEVQGLKLKVFHLTTEQNKRTKLGVGIEKLHASCEKFANERSGRYDYDCKIHLNDVKKQLEELRNQYQAP
jgi:hypothetical protein